jgi:hypothetical protein
MKQTFILIFIVSCMAMLAACSPSSVVQVNTPAPNAPPGTPAPGGGSGEIDVPGLKLSLYAPGRNPMVGTPDYHGRPASFWLGVWHGVISPFTLLASFLGRDTVQMYEVHNDGRLYNLGFFVGVLVMPVVLGAIFGLWR